MRNVRLVTISREAAPRGATECSTRRLLRASRKEYLPLILRALLAPAGAMHQRRFDSDSDDGGASSDDAWQPSRGPRRMGARTEPQCECFCGELLALLWDVCGVCIVPVVARGSC